MPTRTARRWRRPSRDLARSAEGATQLHVLRGSSPGAFASTDRNFCDFWIVGSLLNRDGHRRLVGCVIAARHRRSNGNGLRTNVEASRPDRESGKSCGDLGSTGGRLARSMASRRENRRRAGQSRRSAQKRDPAGQGRKRVSARREASGATACGGRAKLWTSMIEAATERTPPPKPPPLREDRQDRAPGPQVIVPIRPFRDPPPPDPVPSPAPPAKE